jgi:SulP family sulfate permease
MSRVERWIPAVESLRGYDAQMLRRDVVAGVTVAAVAVPQAMAYASIFEMPMQMGLFTAIVMTGIGALLDSSRQLINGPTNAISIAMLSALSLTPPEKRVEAAILMALLIGIIQILITGMRLGDMSRYISHSVIVGFTLGASILLVMDQLKNILGLRAVGDPHDPFLLRFAKTFSQGGPIHWPTLAVALGTMLVAALLRWLNRRRNWQIPELLAALTVAAVVCAATGAADQGVRRIDRIPRELPAFAPPRVDLGLVRDLLPSAVLIGMLGLLEAIAMAKSIAAKTHQKLNIHQQCLSEGVANLAGSFFQCFPGSGSLTRSYINHQAGAATQWSGVFSAVAVAVVILLFAPWAQYIPRAALAGVLMLTAMRMVDLPHLLYHLKATRFDAAIVLATALAAALVSIFFLSFSMFPRRLGWIAWSTSGIDLAGCSRVDPWLWPSLLPPPVIVGASTMWKESCFSGPVQTWRGCWRGSIRNCRKGCGLSCCVFGTPAIQMRSAWSFWSGFSRRFPVGKSSWSYRVWETTCGR